MRVERRSIVSLHSCLNALPNSCFTSPRRIRRSGSNRSSASRTASLILPYWLRGRWIPLSRRTSSYPMCRSAIRRAPKSWRKAPWGKIVTLPTLTDKRSPSPDALASLHEFQDHPVEPLKHGPPVLHEDHVAEALQYDPVGEG